MPIQPTPHQIQQIQTAYRRRILDCWNIPPGSRVLEVGCGQGDMTVARAEFLRRLEQLSREIGMTLPKGATNVIPTGKRVVATHGPEALARVAKMHFKTAKEVLG